MACSGHKTQSFCEQKQKERESINPCRFTVTPDSLTFVTGIIGLLDSTMTLGHIADPLFISVIGNVQKPHKVQTVIETNVSSRCSSMFYVL